MISLFRKDLPDVDKQICVDTAGQYTCTCKELLSFYIVSLKFILHTVYREFFASGNFGENDAWKVCFIFTESNFRYFKNSHRRRIEGLIFRCVYFWRFQGCRELSEN